MKRIAIIFSPIAIIFSPIAILLSHFFDQDCNHTWSIPIERRKLCLSTIPVILVQNQGQNLEFGQLIVPIVHIVFDHEELTSPKIVLILDPPIFFEKLTDEV